MLNYNKLHDRPREFLAATGLTLAEFEKLSPAFQVAYENKYPPDRTRAGKARARRAGAGAKGKLPPLADHARVAIQLESSPNQLFDSCVAARVATRAHCAGDAT